MVLNVPEIPPKVTGIVTLSGGRRGGPGKTTLSLFKDVTIWLGRAGVKGKSDNVTLYDVFFLTAFLNFSLAQLCSSLSLSIVV